MNTTTEETPMGSTTIDDGSNIDTGVDVPLLKENTFTPAEKHVESTATVPESTPAPTAAEAVDQQEDEQRKAAAKREEGRAARWAAEFKSSIKMYPIEIDPEFRDLCPPLAKEELDKLEASILAEGVRDRLHAWKSRPWGNTSLLIDGHHRYEICRRLRIPFNVYIHTTEPDDWGGDVVHFPDRAAVKEWILRTQLGRRNLTDYWRGVLAMQLEDMLRAKAKENQRSAGGAVPQKSAEPVDTRREMAKAADVSPDTMRKIKALKERAPEEVQEALKSGKVSINRAFNDLKETEKPSCQSRAKESPRAAAIAHPSPEISPSPQGQRDTTHDGARVTLIGEIWPVFQHCDEKGTVVRVAGTLSAMADDGENVVTTFEAEGSLAQRLAAEDPNGWRRRTVKITGNLTTFSVSPDRTRKTSRWCARCMDADLEPAKGVLIKISRLAILDDARPDERLAESAAEVAW